MNQTPREIAIEILNLIEKKGLFAEPLLDAFLVKNRRLPLSDRKLLTQIVYGTLRMEGRIDWMIARLYRGNFIRMDTSIKNILRTALYQLYFTDRIPDFAIVDEAVKMTKNMLPAASGLVNAILRNAIRSKDQLPYPDRSNDPANHISVVHSHPLWLVKRWLDRFGEEETFALCRKNNEIPPYTLRMNRLKTTRKRVAEELSQNGFDVKTTAFSPDGLVISHPTVPLRDMALFKSGSIQVQDEASQLIAYLVAPEPGETLLDLCAGTGGKTTHLAEIMENRGWILALDITDGKIKCLKDNAERQGITILDARRGDATRKLAGIRYESFDKILIDAPCSGTGTLRRNPEIKWRISDETVKKMVAVQKAMLHNAAPYLKKGGRLVYSTCSLLSEENQDVVNAFIAAHTEFVPHPLTDTLHISMVDEQGYFRTFPHRHQMDGFFCAVFVKGK
jgi:16S rRNA (cytosine967-C5)-methyltransferase